jgi:hypothetical protein
VKIRSIFPFPAYTVKIELVNLLAEGFHIMANAEIFGIKFNMLVDTGASKTVFDKKNFMEEFPRESILSREELSTGLGTSSMESHLARVSLFKIGNLEIKDMDIALLDLSHIQKAYQSMHLPPISGVIGNDILVPYKAIIHYPQKKIRLFRPDSKSH